MLLLLLLRSSVASAVCLCGLPTWMLLLLLRNSVASEGLLVVDRGVDAGHGHWTTLQMHRKRLYMRLRSRSRLAGITMLLLRSSVASAVSLRALVLHLAREAT